MGFLTNAQAVLDADPELAFASARASLALAEAIGDAQDRLDAKLRAAGERLVGRNVIARRHWAMPEDTLVSMRDSEAASSQVVDDGKGGVAIRPTIVYYAPRLRTGHPSKIERLLHPTPGFTTRTLGAIEAARDRRRGGAR